MEFSSYWGFLFSISAGFLNSFATSIQKNVLDKNSDSYIREKKWWFGFMLLVAAEILGSASFSLLPSTIAVGLSSFSILGIAFFARKKEPLTIKFWCGAASVITASFLNGLVTPAEKKIESFSELVSLLISMDSLIFHVSVLILSFGIHYFYIVKNIKNNQIYALALYAACVSSITILWARAFVIQVISIPNDCGDTGCSYTLKNWLLYTSALITAITGIWAAGFVEQKGLLNNPQTKWLPVHFVFCTITFSAAGIFVYKDWSVFKQNFKTILLIVYSFILYIWGVFVISV